MKKCILLNHISTIPERSFPELIILTHSHFGHYLLDYHIDSLQHRNLEKGFIVHCQLSTT